MAQSTMKRLDEHLLELNNCLPVYDTHPLQCHLQEVPLQEILYVFVYIGIMLIGFR